jgi:MoxR-like ATPase
MNANVASTDRKAVEYDVATLTSIDTGGKKPVLRGYDCLPADAPVYAQDPNHEFDKDLVKAILYGLAYRRKQKFVQIVGPTRCGKTSTLRELFARTNLPALFIQCHPDMEITDLFGTWVLGEKGMVKVYGPVVTAMLRGWTVVLEERDSLKPGVNQALHGLMDTGMVILPQFGGEIVKAHEDFAMFATANTNGNGDEQGIFLASLAQAASSNMRWLNVNADYLPQAKEEALLLRTYLPLVSGAVEKKATTDLVKGFVAFANETRNSVKAGKMLVPCSTGSLRHALDVWMAMGSVRTGIEMAYLNGIGSADRAVAEEVYKNQINVPATPASGTPTPGKAKAGSGKGGQP